MGPAAPATWTMGRHLLVLIAGLVVAWPLLDLDAVFISDEGSYALQARVLRERDTWDMGYPFAAADPDVSFVTYHGARVAGAEVLPYVDHPTWPWSLSATTRFFGEELGLRLIGVVSVVALAAVGWLLARRIDPRAAPLALWMVATSAALAHAWMLWAHAPSAALGGLLVVAVLAASDGDWRWLPVVAAASAAGVLLRAEGLLWAGAVTVALLAVQRSRRALLGAAFVSAGAALAHLVEAAWVDRIAGNGARGEELAARGAGADVVDRLSGLRRVLIDGALASDAGKLLGLGVVILAAAAVVGVRRGARRAPALAMAAAALLLLLRLAVGQEDPIPGLLVVAPSLVFALGLRRGGPDARLLGVTAAVFLGGMALTIYPDGGSFQWGGRYLSPMLAVVAVLGAVALLRAREQLAGRERALFVAATSALLVTQATASLVGPDRIRRSGEAALERVLTSTRPDVFLAANTQIPRLDWKGWPTRCWIAVEDGAPEQVARAVAVLEASGVHEAVAVGFDRDQLARTGAAVGTEVSGVRAAVVSLDGLGDPRIAEPYRCAR